MNARHSHPSAPGPDLLARYLNAYVQARQLTDVERPWGLGDDDLDALWTRLSESIADPQKLDKLVAEELKDADRHRIVETLAPLIFALPLRSYPAELRATRVGARLILSLRHLPAQPSKDSHKNHARRADSEVAGDPAHEGSSETAQAKPAKESKHSCRGKDKDKEKADAIDSVGFLPAALTEPLACYLRRVLHWPDERHWCVVTISSGGRRRKVRVTVLSKGRGVVVRFLERLHSPVDESA